MLDKHYIENTLHSSNEFLENIGIIRKNGSINKGGQKKLNEIIGFCEHFFKAIDLYLNKKKIVILECSCGKSYLSFVINYLLYNKFKDLKTHFLGVDINKTLIDKCNEIKSSLNYPNMEFFEGSTIEFEPGQTIDIVIALHACDTATDEAIVKGIKIDARFIIVVPCCQNQIRSQLKHGHSLNALTDFGLLRYRFANILTDGLRSQFLKGSGYNVELKEIVTPRTTPKNLIIIARKKRKTVENSFNLFNNLRQTFNIKSKLLEYFDDSLFKN